jgi:hypothetical protein
MEQPGDVAAISNAAVALTPAPGGHQLSGVNTNGDVQVTLLGSANNARPIPSTRYRHLTFTLTVDGAYDLGLGSVARVFWATSPWDGQNVTTTSQDIKVFPGRHTYTVDLGSLSSVSDPLLGRTIEYECAVCPTTPWGAKGIWSLRIDPHEFVAPRGFHLDNVFLRATEEVALGGAPFAVRWWIADSDAVAGQHTVRVYWDNDQTPDAGFASGSSSKLIATRSGALVNALDQAMWTPSPSMPPGEYFMYVHVTDGATGASRGMYSSGRIRVFQPVSPPVITTLRPAFGGTAFVPFAIEGCAGETAAPTGSGVDDLIVYAIGGPTVEIPAQRGQRFALGLLPSAPGLGTQQTGLPCPGGATPGIAASGGFRISGLSDLSAGPWTLRVLARGVNSRVFGVQDIPFVVDWRSGPARNLRLAATSGSSITIAWDPPVEGRAVTAYRIEVALTPAFSPLAGQVRVPPNVTSGSGVLGNGSWFVRVVTESAYSNQGPPSNVLGVTLPGGGAPSPGVPPGSPVLRVVQVTSNAVSLSWTAGGGGAPTSYVLAAGTGPGASNLGVFNVSGLTSVSSPIPAGVPIYARVVASNVAGSAASNEVVFTAAGPTPPARPTMNPPAVSGRNVTLSWGGVAGATSYTVIARLPGTSTVITSLPGQTGTSVYVPNVPPGTYAASVVAFNAAGPSPESNQVLVVVQ